MRPRFFPSLPNQNPPPRSQQRVGSGGYTEFKGSSADGGGGVKIGVIDNANDSYDAYGYISFDTGHSSQVYCLLLFSYFHPHAILSFSLLVCHP